MPAPTDEDPILLQEIRDQEIGIPEEEKIMEKIADVPSSSQFRETIIDEDDDDDDPFAVRHPEEEVEEDRKTNESLMDREAFSYGDCSIIDNTPLDLLSEINHLEELVEENKKIFIQKQSDANHISFYKVKAKKIANLEAEKAWKEYQQVETKLKEAKKLLNKRQNRPASRKVNPASSDSQENGLLENSVSLSQHPVNLNLYSHQNGDLEDDQLESDITISQSKGDQPQGGDSDKLVIEKATPTTMELLQEAIAELNRIEKIWIKTPRFKRNSRKKAAEDVDAAKFKIQMLKKRIEQEEKNVKEFIAFMITPKENKNNNKNDNNNNHHQDEIYREELLKEILVIRLFAKTELLKYQELLPTYQNCESFNKELANVKYRADETGKFYNSYKEKRKKLENSILADTAFAEENKMILKFIREYENYKNFLQVLESYRERRAWNNAINRLHQAYWKRQYLLRDIAICIREGCYFNENKQSFSSNLAGIETKANEANVEAIVAAKHIEILRRIPKITITEIQKEENRLDSFTENEKEIQIYQIVGIKATTITAEEIENELTLTLVERQERARKEINQAIKEFHQAQKRKEKANLNLQNGFYYFEDYGRLIHVNDSFQMQQELIEATQELLHAAKRVEKTRLALLPSEEWKIEIERIISLSPEEREQQLLSMSIPSNEPVAALEEQGLDQEEDNNDNLLEWSSKWIVDAVTAMRYKWDNFDFKLMKNHPARQEEMNHRRAYWDRIIEKEKLISDTPQRKL
jgi:hypothetical protein